MSVGMEHATCCVCFELENKIGCISCDRCNDGVLCLECYIVIEENAPDLITNCPVCRSIFISHTIMRIVEYGLANKYGWKERTSLIDRWLNQSPIYNLAYPGFEYTRISYTGKDKYHYEILDENGKYQRVIPDTSTNSSA